MSMIFTIIITLILFAVSVGIKFYWAKRKGAFCVSSFLNPYYVMYEVFDFYRDKKKTNSNEDDKPHKDDNKKKRE